MLVLVKMGLVLIICGIIIVICHLIACIMDIFGVCWLWIGFMIIGLILLFLGVS